MTQFKINFLSTGRQPECTPNPEYPHGIDLDPGERPACLASLPYPADCVGTWIVSCKRCKTSVAITAAGRPDDPRTIMIPCKKKAH